MVKFEIWQHSKPALNIQGFTTNTLNRAKCEAIAHRHTRARANTHTRTHTQTHTRTQALPNKLNKYFPHQSVSWGQ